MNTSGFFHPVRSWVNRNQLELKIFFSVWLVYAVFATPAGGVTPNRYVDLVHAIVNEGRFEIDTYHANTVDKSYYNGHYYAGALPGPSFLSIPAYLVFKTLYAQVPDTLLRNASTIQSLKANSTGEADFYSEVDTVEFFLSQWFINIFVLAVVSAFGVLFLLKTLQLLNFNPAIAVRVCLLYAFGTILFFYSTTFFEQAFSAALASAGVWLTLKTVQSNDANLTNKYSMVTGLVIGLGLLVEYTTVFFSGWLVLWVLLAKKWKVIFILVAGAIPPILALMLYNTVVFDNPLSSPYLYLIEEHHKVHGTGFFGATYPRLDRLYELILGSERGLLWYIPLTIIGFGGLIVQVRKKSQHVVWVSILVSLTYLFFYSAYTNWRGGSAFGPRYLVPALPFVFIGLAYAYQQWSHLWIDLIGIYSILVNWLGAQFDFADSVIEHVMTFWLEGPALASFGAVLSHSTDPSSRLHQWADFLHTPVTLLLTCLLIVVILILFKTELFRQPSRLADAKG